MIRGIGIDIVHVDRIRHWSSVPGLIERFFHPDEIEAVSLRGASRDLSLAARFAAKEAFGKACGTGLRNMKLKDIYVKNERNGRPVIILAGTAKQRFSELGGGILHCSLPHEGDNAVAIVIIEDERIS
jgi:holo-[acyl-carrier protein] synthase